MTDVTIVGAGVAGLCVARALVDRGATVRMVDRAGGPTSAGCSWWAGGMLAPFCEGETAEEPVVRLGQTAARWWQDKTGAVTSRGSLVVAQPRDRADLAQFGRRTTGFDTVDETQIAELEPDLAGRFSRGLYFATEAHLTPRVALTALRDGLARDGVTIEQIEVDPADLAQSGLTVDCRGLAAKPRHADMRGVKGEMLHLLCPDVSLSRPVRLLHPRIPLYIVPRGDGVYMLGATMIEGAVDKTSNANDPAASGANPTARSILELLSAAYALHPAFGAAEVLEIGVDSRPAFADNLPRIRRSGNLIACNGLHRHGFLLAPSLGQMIADHIFSNSTPEVMDAHPA